jgi:hypothetical protein
MRIGGRHCACLLEGESLSGIARKLSKWENQIRRIVRSFGIAPKVYGEIVERADEKRLCSECRRWKTRGAFPSDRHSVCRVCYKN